MNTVKDVDAFGKAPLAQLPQVVVQREDPLVLEKRSVGYRITRNIACGKFAGALFEQRA